MGRYGEQISELPLYALLTSKARGKRGQTADVGKLSGLVLEIADLAGPLLANIPVTFKQYTTHDIGHAANLIDLMGRFIPKKTQQTMSAVEVAVLMLSALLHDLGMYVTEEEKTQYLESERFRSFLAASPDKEHAIAEAAAAGKRGTVRAIEDAALADYFRKLHPKRAGENIDRYLAGKLTWNEIDLAPWVKTICESHGWPVYESNDPSDPNKAIARALKPSDPLFGVPFHPQYIACCLRLADIMDFDRSRTPLTLLRTITDETSQREWEKHLSITGWTIDEHDVEFHAKCRHPEHYVAVLDFLDAVDRELLECRRLVVRDATQQTKGYSLQLPTAVDRIYVKMADESYIAGGFRFELEYERIMKLLMDKSLYPDPSLFLRELLQNSLDACRLRKALAEEEGTGDLYTPHIVVRDNSADETSPSIVFQDNGVGMSEDVVKNYFMRVGRSYYRSGEFNAQRQRLAARKIALEATSQFGIGFLSCFMVADRVEIETYRIGEDPLHIEIEGATKYFVIRRLAKPAPAQIGAIPAEPENDGPPKYAGTRITVHLREAKPLNVKQVIDQFAVNVEFPVLTIEGEAKHVTSAWRWMTEPITFDEMATESDVNREGLESILTLVDRRLDEYDFCDGLIGGIWFWLLRTADGKGVPRHGHLRIGQELSPAGVPGILSGLRPPERDAIRASDLAEIEPAPGISPEVVTLWNTSTRDERREMLGFLARPVQFAPWWSSSTEAMLLLHGGGDGWKSMAHQLTIPALIAGSESLAQHGIVLPAGITDWQPMQGTSERLRLIRFAGGFRVDDRRADAPEPAASRLYVDAAGGARVAVPVGRALLRFAIDLFRQHQDERWLEQFCDSANAPEYWDVIAFLEAPLVREHIRHLVVHNDATDERWTEAQVRERWGNIVPIVTYNADDAGILSEAGVNRLVLGRKERFERDGQWFVDLDSELTQAATWPEMWRNE